MIEFRDVRFSYYDKEVIKGVSFKIPSGESRIIMGHSGSGKSTMLRLILGLEKPDSGDILIDGRSIIGIKEKELRKIRKSIGMVFQDGALFDSLTVGENIGYYLLEHTKMQFAEIEDKVCEMLKFVGLTSDIVDQLPDQLSGGMQRRVSIGRAMLSTNPKIMLYDEPTTGLDPRMVSQIIRLIRKLNDEQNVTTVVVTHQIADAFEICNDFIIVDTGEIVFDGSVSDLNDQADSRVMEFLRPFRESIINVKKTDFV